MSYTIVFKKNLSPVNKFTKSFGASTQSVDVVLKENTDLFQPTFVLQTSVDLSQYNYIDGSSFSGRQYFIVDVRSIGYQRYEVDAKTDVLSTWKNEILANTAVVGRQEKKFNLYLDDHYFRVYNYERIQTLLFPDNDFMKQLQYVLVTNGYSSASSSEFSQLKNEEGGEDNGINTDSRYEI